MPLALSGWWTIGWVVGAVVVVLVAVLILVITSLARKVANEANEVGGGLDGVGAKTRGLQDLSGTHVTLRRITNGLRRARGETNLPRRPGGTP